jgi:hypothetical protein
VILASDVKTALLRDYEPVGADPSRHVNIAAGRWGIVDYAPGKIEIWAYRTHDAIIGVLTTGDATPEDMAAVVAERFAMKRKEPKP